MGYFGIFSIDLQLDIVFSLDVQKVGSQVGIFLLELQISLLKLYNLSFEAGYQLRRALQGMELSQFILQFHVLSS